MRSANVAEWILSQVLPPDRAASTVGDWLENADERGAVWFWSCVFRTVLSHVWKDFVADPGFIAGLALRGWLFSLVLYVTATIALIPVIYLFVVLFQLLPWHGAHAAFWFLAELLGWATAAGYGALTGRWTARRTTAGKLAACFACCIMNSILNGAIQLGSNQFLSSNLKTSLASRAASTPWIVEQLIFDIGLIAGFLWLPRPERGVIQ